VDPEVRTAVRSVLLVALILWGWGGAALAQSELEQKVKAAFLFNFLKFVTWPESRAPADQEPYVLCVIGDERFAQTLEQVVQSKTVSGHGLKVRSLAEGGSAQTCHLAYLASDRATPAAEAALSGLSGGGILTVHEAPAAVPSGVMRFFLEQQRIRFEINTAAAERENLQLSSRLMGVAERVQVSAPP
jgi:hypothetical protein